METPAAETFSLPVPNDAHPEPSLGETKSQAVQLERIDNSKFIPQAVDGEGLRVKKVPLVANRPVLHRVGSKCTPVVLSQALDSPRNNPSDLVKTFVYEAVGLGFQAF